MQFNVFLPPRRVRGYDYILMSPFAKFDVLLRGETISRHAVYRIHVHIDVVVLYQKYLTRLGEL